MKSLNRTETVCLKKKTKRFEIVCARCQIKRLYSMYTFSYMNYQKDKESSYSHTLPECPAFYLISLNFLVFLYLTLVTLLSVHTVCGCFHLVVYLLPRSKASIVC